jgi:hypothetical protein
MLSDLITYIGVVILSDYNYYKFCGMLYKSEVYWITIMYIYT